MSGLSRRDLLRSTVAAAALAGIGISTNANGQRAASVQAPATLKDIDHIIVLMKENRSFDHYFGTLSGVRGYSDPSPIARGSGRSVFHQPDETRKEGYVLPFHVDTTHTSGQAYQVLSHEWGPLHESWNGGAMDRWIPAHRGKSPEGIRNAQLTMGYYSRADLPFYYALADVFTICDGYHASVMGPTHPNRIYLMTGSIDPLGTGGGPAIDNRGRHYAWETYPERLQKAGVSWCIYHAQDDYGCNVTKYFKQYQDLDKAQPLHEHSLRVREFETLLSDLRTGNIPQVTWIVPPSVESEHPSFLPAAGERHTQRVLNALWSNPALWARSLVILNYDENDGQFDHVPPPVPPQGTPGEYVNGVPIGLGFRVPCLLISPFTRGGYVCSETFDHTSTLRLMETRFGVEVPYLSDWRRKTCGDFTRALGLGEAPRVDLPSLPDAEAHFTAVEAAVGALPAPQVPDLQAQPSQEPGSR